MYTKRIGQAFAGLPLWMSSLTNRVSTFQTTPVRTSSDFDHLFAKLLWFYFHYFQNNRKNLNFVVRCFCDENKNKTKKFRSNSELIYKLFRQLLSIENNKIFFVWFSIIKQSQKLSPLRIRIQQNNMKNCFRQSKSGSCKR